MFPLGSVLLPGGLLPLHVFEPRYRQMVIDCLAEDGEPEFGQALITHGREAGGGDERATVGTVAQVLQIDALDEGRYALVASGRGGSGSTRGCPMTRTRSPMSTTGPTTIRTRPARGRRGARPPTCSRDAGSRRHD